MKRYIVASRVAKNFNAKKKKSKCVNKLSLILHSTIYDLALKVRTTVNVRVLTASVLCAVEFTKHRVRRYGCAVWPQAISTLGVTLYVCVNKIDTVSRQKYVHCEKQKRVDGVCDLGEFKVTSEHP